jgi:hypothetical protein
MGVKIYNHLPTEIKSMLEKDLNLNWLHFYYRIPFILLRNSLKSNMSRNGIISWFYNYVLWWYVSDCGRMCILNILYEVDVQPDLYCVITYLIIGLSSMLNDILYGVYHRRLCLLYTLWYPVEFILHDWLSGISDDGFYICVHRSLEHTLNMNTIWGEPRIWTDEWVYSGINFTQVRVAVPPQTNITECRGKTVFLIKFKVFQKIKN